MTGRHMRRAAMTVAISLLSLWLNAGCRVSTKHDAVPQSELSSTPSAASKVNDEQLLLNELAETPPCDDQLRPWTNPSANCDRYEFPSLANDGVNLVLFVDRESNIAWLSRTGGIAGHLSSTRGPWQLDEPVLASLLTSLERKRQLEREEFARHKREAADRAELDQQRRPWWQLSSGRIR